MIRRTFTLALFLALCLTLFSASAWAEAPITYLDADGSEQTCENYTLLTGSDRRAFLDGGWYAVTGDVVYNIGLFFSGNTHLILADGAHITAIADSDVSAIVLNTSNAGNLTIYGQAAGTGILTAAGITDGSRYGIEADGTVTVNGGTIDGGGDSSNSKIMANGGLTLNPNGTDSCFRVGGIEIDTPVTVAAGKSMTDGNGCYFIGTLTNEERAAMAGKLLRQGPAPHAVTLDTSIPEGALTASRTVAVEGMEITLTGSDSYVISSVAATDGGGQSLLLTQSGNTWSFTMPGSGVTVTAEATEKERTQVSGTYNVTADTTLYGITLTGNTVIDLAEGTTLTVDGGEPEFNDWELVKSGNAIEGNYALTIQGAGTLILNAGSCGISVKNLTVVGGVIQDHSNQGCYGNDSTAVTGGSFNGKIYSNGKTTISGGAISGKVSGEIEITGGSVSGEIKGNGDSVTIRGGQINASSIGSYLDATWAGTITKGPVTLGCATGDDFITIGTLGDCESVSIGDGVTLYDEAGNAYSGTLSEEQIAAVAGKTLRNSRTYAVAIDANIENGSVTPFGDKTRFAAGDTVTLTVSPAAGYALTDLAVTYTDGEGAAQTITPVQDGTDQTKYTFTMPAGNVQVSAAFRQILRIFIQWSDNSHSDIELISGFAGDEGNYTAIVGDTVTFRVAPYPGYGMSSVSATEDYGEQVVTVTDLGEGKYSFVMPDYNVDLYAECKGVRVDIPTGHGTVTMVPEHPKVGNTVTLNFSPEEGYALDTLAVTKDDTDPAETVEITPSGTEGEYTFTMPEVNVTVIATFKLAFGTPDFTLPAALQSIEANAFEGAKMTVVNVPDTCIEIGANAFKNCTALTQIRLPKDCDIDGSAFTGCGTVYIFAPAGGATEEWCRNRTGIVFVEEE